MKTALVLFVKYVIYTLFMIGDNEVKKNQLTSGCVTIIRGSASRTIVPPCFSICYTGQICCIPFKTACTLTDRVCTCCISEATVTGTCTGAWCIVALHCWESRWHSITILLIGNQIKPGIVHKTHPRHINYHLMNMMQLQNSLYRLQKLF